MGGVSIASGAVIGAYSVVTKHVGPYWIVGGNPARLIRKRFTEEQIGELLRIMWWNWPLDKIKANLPLLLSEDITTFIQKHNT